MDEARGDEATQSGQQQQCILSGEVYLRHRLKDNFLPFLQQKYNIITQGRASPACWRAGVQETVRFLPKMSALSLATQVLIK
jgi:hypothetical protein